MCKKEGAEIFILEFAEHSEAADGPGFFDVGGTFFKADFLKAGVEHPLCIFADAAETWEAPFTADRFEEVAHFPGFGLFFGEPGANDEPSAGLQNAVSLLEEFSFIDHMFGAFYCDGHIETVGRECIVEPISLNIIDVRGLGSGVFELFTRERKAGRFDAIPFG